MKLVSPLFACLLAANAVAAAAYASVRRGFHQTDSFVFCRVVLVDIMHENDEVYEEQACVPIVNGKETEDLITVTLPTDLKENNAVKLEDGRLYVNITHAELTDGDITFTPVSEFLIVGQLPLHLRHLEQETGSWRAPRQLRSYESRPPIRIPQFPSKTS